MTRMDEYEQVIIMLILKDKKEAEQCISSILVKMAVAKSRDNLR